MTYRRTKLTLLLCGVLSTAVLAAAVVRLNTRGNITRANYDKIRTGVTLAEVEAILGAPSDDLPPLSYQDIQADESALWTYPPPHELRYWKNETHMITVIVDSQGRVAGKSYSRNPDIGAVRRIIDSLGL